MYKKKYQKPELKVLVVELENTLCASSVYLYPEGKERMPIVYDFKEEVITSESGFEEL